MNYCFPKTGNSFVVTGRGGVPEDPSQILRGRTLWQDLRTFDLDEENWEETEHGEKQQPFSSSREEIHPEENLTSRRSSIVEAKGWVIDGDGNVELVADMPNDKLRRLGSSRTSHCY